MTYTQLTPQIRLTTVGIEVVGAKPFLVAKEGLGQLSGERATVFRPWRSYNEPLSDGWTISWGFPWWSRVDYLCAVAP